MIQIYDRANAIKKLGIKLNSQISTLPLFFIFPGNSLPTPKVKDNRAEYTVDAKVDKAVQNVSLFLVTIKILQLGVNNVSKKRPINFFFFIYELFGYEKDDRSDSINFPLFFREYSLKLFTKYH